MLYENQKKFKCNIKDLQISSVGLQYMCYTLKT